MTPQERQLVAELFDRLATLESAPREAEALRAIDDGLQRAPNALYPLVQTVLVQDEALKRADARIRELEAELGIEQPAAAQDNSFLDGMRGPISDRREGQGSVPTVRPGSGPAMSRAWRTTSVPQDGYGPRDDYPPQGQGMGPGMGPGAGPGMGGPGAGPFGGGSFLGTAAASAVGMIGGSLLMSSMRGLMGGGQAKASTLGSGLGSSPGGGAGGGNLAQQAGLGDIGGGANAAGDGGTQRTGLFGGGDAGDDMDHEQDHDFDFGDDE
jgi:hypothetical protein